MTTLFVFLQVIVGLGILNVWLVRRNRSTPFRGGNAQSMKEEFSYYGLPGWSLYVIGTSKVLFALVILAGLWLPQVTAIGAAGLGFMMFGAVLMHIRVGDSVTKTLPALMMLLVCCVLAMKSRPELLVALESF